MYQPWHRRKVTLTEKVTIDNETKSIISWINSKPITLQKYLLANPDIKLNPHGEVTLKKKLNEDTGSNTERSPRRSLK